MLLYVLKLNQNAKMPEAYGKYYAYPVITQTVGIDGLAEHMASHNTPFVYHHYSVPTILQVVTRICFRKKLFYYRF